MNEVKKGLYDKAEVDSYVKELVKNYEETLIEQKDRIFSQIEDLEKLKKELFTYRKKEKFISEAIVSALAKADQIEVAARAKYENELSKLRAFYQKLSAYYEHIRTIYPPNEEFKNIEQFLNSLDDVLEKKSKFLDNPPLTEDDELTLKAYEEERHRLMKNGWQIKPLEEQINNEKLQGKAEKLFNKNVSGAEEIAANLLVGLDIKTPVSKIKRHLDREIRKEPPPAVIDLDELLKPTQSLEDLCAELGLLSD